MIGSSFLIASPGPSAPEDLDGLRGYALQEFGCGATAWIDAAAVPSRNATGIPLNGGRDGRMANARRAMSVLGAILLSPISGRPSARRTAHNHLTDFAS